MKFRKGDKVCLLLVNSRWGIDVTCFVGRLVKIEVSPYAKAAHVDVTRYISLVKNEKYKQPTLYKVDVKHFKLLPFDEHTKAHVRDILKQSRRLCKTMQSLTTKT